MCADSKRVIVYLNTPARANGTPIMRGSGVCTGPAYRFRMPTGAIAALLAGQRWRLGTLPPRVVYFHSMHPISAFPSELYAVFCGQIDQLSVQHIFAAVEEASRNSVKSIHILFQIGRASCRERV